LPASPLMTISGLDASDVDRLLTSLAELAGG
jgi:hypothetical protein